MLMEIQVSILKKSTHNNMFNLTPKPRDFLRRTQKNARLLRRLT